MILALSKNRFVAIAVIVILLQIATFMLPVRASENVELLISRSSHTLLVKQGNVTLQSFKVAFGSGGKKAKLREGDRTTPKGTYLISNVRTSDRFHLFMQLNYPNMNDAKRALKTKLISRKQYRDILDAQIAGRMPPQNTGLGGAIGIHGIGVETQEKIEIHQFADWTQGCIAMRNDEVEALSGYISYGTKVTITD